MCPHQLTYFDFVSEEELNAWSNAKYEASADPSYPDRVHESNPRLSERYYSHNKGRDINKFTSITEQLEKSGTDALSGVTALALQDVAEKGSKSGQDRHKAIMTKINTTLTKLNKSIGKAETSLPSMKRRVSASTYTCMREGLAKVRQIKDSQMDHLEDAKENPDDPFKQEENLEHLGHILLALQSALEILGEAMAKTEEPLPKKERTQAPEPAAGHWD